MSSTERGHKCPVTLGALGTRDLKEVGISRSVVSGGGMLVEEVGDVGGESGC